MTTIGAMVLAAGGSVRFGSPKQLAVLGGRPLLEYPCVAMSAVCSLDRRVVVLGADAPRIAGAVDPHGADVVVCTSWADGLAASLAAGLEALGDVDAAAILLGDQPLVTAEVLAMVIEAASGPWPAARATFAGAPGHPVVLRRPLFGHVRGLRGDRGAGQLLSTVEVTSVEVAHLCRDLDVDSRADLRAAEDILVGREGFEPP